MDQKEIHPFLERIEDRKSILRLMPGYKAHITYLILRFYFYHLLFSIYNYILRDYFKIYLKIIFVTLYNFVRKTFDIQLRTLMKSVKRVPSTTKLVIFGHAHEKVNEYHTKINKWVLVLDTWREEYSFSDNLKFLVPKTKRYAKIIVEDNQLKVTLTDLSPKGGKILFEKVCEDEVKYSKKVFDDRHNLHLKDYEIDETNFTL